MALRIAAPTKGTASIILLHGLGDSGQGWSFLASECHQKPNLRHINFVLPNAPLRNYPAFGGTTPGWYGMSGTGRSIEEVVNDWDGLQSTLKLIKSLVDAEISKGIDPRRILIGGFSQGAGATQSFAATYKDHQLAGFVSLSGFLPHLKNLEAIKSATNTAQPFFIAHGTADQIVPYQESEKSMKLLRSTFAFTNLQLHTYEGLPHSVDENLLSDLYRFLENTLPN